MTVREPDTAGDIWKAAVAAGLVEGLSTAEARVRLDRFLRAELAQIADGSLRAHAAEIIRDHRARALNGFPPDCRQRFERIEEALGILPRRRGGEGEE